MKHILSIVFVIISIQAFGQKTITTEDIWALGTFRQNYIPGFNFLKDGKHYSLQSGVNISKYDLTTGKEVGTLFNGSAAGLKDMDGYTFSDDEKMLLIETNSKSIYRHSYTAENYIWDGEKLEPLSDKGAQMYATFSPDNSKVAFVRANNLFYKDLTTGEEKQVTADGEKNKIINGATDWVYEEEFALVRAFEWSPDGKSLAFLRTDEREVKEFIMPMYTDEAYPEYYTFKYPKVGEDNAKVSMHVYHLNSNIQMKLPVKGDNPDDFYIPRFQWTKDASTLAVMVLNRHQNHLKMYTVNTSNGKTKVLFEEKNKYYIDIHDNLHFLKDRQHFTWTSEQDGYNHIYLYGMDGNLKKQITKGDWEVTDFYGVDEANGLIYFQSAEESPMERYVYSIGLDGKGKKRLTKEEGVNAASFSSTFDYFVLTQSTINRAAKYSVHDRKGKEVRMIEDNAGLAKIQADYGVQPVEFFDFKTSEGVELNGWMIKPANFNEKNQYPVFMYEYGGPGSQQVKDQWKGANYWWFQMLARQGYIIACVDNRGTGARGEEFKKMTYQQLGKYETIDQIEAAKYLGGLPYADANRIGIFGWSYGGYLSSLCILKGNDVFKAAIAVAPVTNWKWYDTIYTERYMRTNKENPNGYKENSPVYFADRLKGNYLLVHGMGDDNVHFQNTTEMVNALVNNNKQFDTYFYPNRNHGIYGGYTRLHLYNKMTDFVLNKL